MRITADRRRIDVADGWEETSDLPLRRMGMRRHQLALAERLVEIDGGRQYAPHGCSSTAQFARRFGLGEYETRTLLGVGRAVAAVPTLRSEVMGGRIPLDSAAALGLLASTPGGQDALRDDLETWVDAAATLSTSAFRQLVRKRRAELRKAKQVVSVTVHVDEDTREDMDRARVVASNRRRRALTLDETVEEMTEHYLDSFDPLRQEDTRRPEGSAEHDPAKRDIPRWVERHVRRRASDCCEVPGCRWKTNLEFAHIVAHRHRGSRAPDNIFLLCWMHHTLYDSGLMTLVERREEGFVFEAWGGRLEPPRDFASTLVGAGHFPGGKSPYAAPSDPYGIDPAGTDPPAS